MKKTVISVAILALFGVSTTLVAGDLKASNFEIPNASMGYSLKDAAALNLRNTIYLKSDVDALIKETNDNKAMISGNQTAIGGLRTEDELMKKRFEEMQTKIDALELKLSLVKTGMSPTDTQDIKVLQTTVKSLEAKIEELQGGAVKPDMRIKVDQKLLDFVNNKR